MASARAVSRQSFHPGNLSPHRRAQAGRGNVECWAHEGPYFDHCLEVRTTGALGTVLLSRQNLGELKRAIAEAEQLFEQLDDSGGSKKWLRPPEKLSF